MGSLAPGLQMSADMIELVSYVFNPLVPPGFGYLLIFLLAAQAKNWIYGQ